MFEENIILANVWWASNVIPKAPMEIRLNLMAQLWRFWKCPDDWWHGFQKLTDFDRPQINSKYSMCNSIFQVRPTNKLSISATALLGPSVGIQLDNVVAFQLF